MNKQQLREHLNQAVHRHTHIYGNEIHTYAESVDQAKRLQKRCETRKKPAHLVQAEWEKYLTEVQAGTYQPEPQDVDLYDYTGL
jgi:hypothetical protein